MSPNFGEMSRFTGQIKILNMYQDCSASPFNINLRDIGLTNPKENVKSEK